MPAARRGVSVGLGRQGLGGQVGVGRPRVQRGATGLHPWRPSAGLGEILWSFSKDHGARPGGRAARAEAAELNEPGAVAGLRAGVRVGSGSWSAGSGVPAAGPSL